MLLVSVDRHDFPVYLNAGNWFRFESVSTSYLNSTKMLIGWYRTIVFDLVSLNSPNNNVLYIVVSAYIRLTGESFASRITFRSFYLSQLCGISYRYVYIAFSYRINPIASSFLS